MTLITRRFVGHFQAFEHCPHALHDKRQGFCLLSEILNCFSFLFSFAEWFSNSGCSSDSVMQNGISQVVDIYLILPKFQQFKEVKLISLAVFGFSSPFCYESFGVDPLENTQTIPPVTVIATYNCLSSHLDCNLLKGRLPFKTGLTLCDVPSTPLCCMVLMKC